MKKKKIILSFLLFLIIFISFLNRNNVKAETKGLDKIGIYTISIPVKAPTKVYVQKELVDYLKSEGVYVRTEKRNFFVKDYYYIANKYVEKIVYSREVSNDIDSMIFMISELEKIAIEINSNQYKNLVLGYLRSFNKKYYNGWYGAWSFVAGDVDENFVKVVAEREEGKVGIKINEYFAQFVDKNLYNERLHGVLDEKWLRDKSLLLKDPSDNNKSIDLIHMIASIDGIYMKTVPINFFVKRDNIGRDMQRDIASWNGDLQSAISILVSQEKNNELPDLNDEKNGKMKLLFGKTDEGNDIYSCSEEDILADIDAMNISKMFVDHDNNTISRSLSSYYGILNNNPKFRYITFVKTVIIDEEKPLKNKSDLERFENEVLTELNLKRNGEKYEDYSSFVEDAFLGYSIMRNDIIDIERIKERKKPIIKMGEMPPLYIRVFVAESFINYIEDNI